MIINKNNCWQLKKLKLDQKACNQVNLKDQKKGQIPNSKTKKKKISISITANN
jgi:hypothetical protein